MNKGDLIAQVAETAGLTKSQASDAVNGVFDAIQSTLKAGDKAAFVGFGTFKTSVSKARDVKTPRGTIAHVPEKRVVKFSAGVDLKAKANSKK